MSVNNIDMDKKKKILFLTGTRADYGKIKRIMKLIEASDKFELFVFVTGMHMHKKYGSTYKEIVKDGYKNIYFYMNQQADAGAIMDITLANTISGFSSYVRETEPDLIVIHGDRLEALAGVTVAAMNNVLAAHIEGGEVSGTIDESIRHAVTKLAHVHFAANEASKNRIVQLGELKENIFVIGSPDIDIMLNSELPSWNEVKQHYEIPFDDFGVALFHPVTTSYKNMGDYAKNFTDALLDSRFNWIVIHPNNDLGREFITEQYERLSADEKFRIFPSVRFEYFLIMLKNAGIIAGNSSAGIRESEVYGIPAVDVGDRQKNRYEAESGLVHCGYGTDEILESIRSIYGKKMIRQLKFGKGNSAELFMDIINSSNFWSISIQKHFIDLD